MKILKKLWKIIKTNENLNILSSFIYNSCNKNKIKKHGKNIVINNKRCFLKNVKFNIEGNNIRITIGDYTRLEKCQFIIKGNNHNLTIGNNCMLLNSNFWFEDDTCEININDKVTCTGALFALVEPNSKIDIGQDCMFSHDIELRTSDSHSIIDINTNNRINPAKNIKIGNHVWVGAHSRILKGVTIEENSIIGLGSIVTKNIKKNTINVGIPAKTVKENITWDREKIYV